MSGAGQGRVGIGRRRGRIRAYQGRARAGQGREGQGKAGAAQVRDLSTTIGSRQLHTSRARLPTRPWAQSQASRSGDKARYKPTFNGLQLASHHLLRYEGGHLALLRTVPVSAEKDNTA